VALLPRNQKNYIFMKVNEVIKKLKLMLAESTDVVEETKVKEEMAEATLVDGTEVYTEGEIVPGAILFVRAGEGVSEDPFAPEGIHETTSGLLITVGEGGEIVSVEEKAPVEAGKKTKMAEDESAIAKEVEMSLDDILMAIAQILAPYIKDMNGIKEEIEVLESRFNKVANEPAAKKISSSFKADIATPSTTAEARFEKLVQLRKAGSKLN
jgi:hypothetical protein